MLLERDEELAAVAGLLDAAADGRGGVLWIEGPAGIGKTCLSDGARERARSAGMRVLTARASDLERDFAFGVIRSLFEQLLATAGLAERDELLAGAARLAEPVITLDGPPARAEPAASLGTLHGLYWLCANLADTGPVLLSVDDAHWSDVASLRALAYLGRRIDELPVALLVAARPVGPELDPALVDAVTESATVLRPAVLSRAGTDVLVGERIPGHGEAFRSACHEATGGNPLLVRALVRVLADAGVTADEHGVRAVAERAPAIVATSVTERLRRSGTAPAAVARAAAVLRGGAPLRHVSAVAGLNAEAVAGAAQVLVGLGLLLDGRSFTFTHPLVEQAVDEQTSPAERHRGHRTAAWVLAAEDASPERVAGHLLRTEALGDPEVVEGLRTAARAALAKGAPEAAMTYLRRAFDEPPPSSERAVVLAELGAATVRVSFTEGVALLEEALAVTREPARRARVALELARSLRTTLQFDRALAVVDDAIAVLGGVDSTEPELALELEAEAVGLARRDPERRAAAEERGRRLRSAGLLSGRGGAVLLANAALDALQDDGGSLAIALAREALTITLAEDVPDPSVLLPATMVLVAIDHLEPVRGACEAMISSARRRGSTYDFASGSVLRAQTRYLQGALVEAEADARLADDLTAEHGVRDARPYTQAWLVLVLVEQGRLAEAEASLAESEVTANLAYLLDARGRLRLAQGRADDALADFLACGQRMHRRGLRHPGLMTWQANAALALHQLERTEEARRTAEDAARTARSYAAPRALGVALRALGLVSGELDALREAVTILAPTPAHLEHARAQIDLGAALRRGNQRTLARDELARGQDLAARCGADALVARAREELLAAGARPRTVALHGVDALTASERRVAELASDGLSNREVAQALFVTTKTVETHLGHVYRKLAVGGRDDLTGALT